MNRILAVLLIVLGVAGLILGRLGETVWAPAQERTATVALSDPGPAVVIDPGVLYVGGHQGTVTVKGDGDVSVITGSKSDLEAYLADTEYTVVTGVPQWDTLATEQRNADGATELKNPTASDLWRSVDTQGSTATVDIAEFWAGESGKNERPYRPILLVTDGTEPGAQEITISWPVQASNEWVPYAYAGGAALAVIGLVLLVVAPRRRRDDELEGEELEDEELADDLLGEDDDVAGTAVAADAPATEDDAIAGRDEPVTAADDDITDAEADQEDHR